ncbi:MAG: hypothetical protein MHPSP_003149, partial [Paramarteilia canceri]
MESELRNILSKNYSKLLNDDIFFQKLSKDVPLTLTFSCNISNNQIWNQLNLLNTQSEKCINEMPKNDFKDQKIEYIEINENFDKINNCEADILNEENASIEEESDFSDFLRYE